MQELNILAHKLTSQGYLKEFYQLHLLFMYVCYTVYYSIGPTYNNYETIKANS